MGTKRSFWLAALAMSVILVGGGNCFGQSIPSGVTIDSIDMALNGNSPELVRAIRQVPSAHGPAVRIQRQHPVHDAKLFR